MGLQLLSAGKRSGTQRAYRKPRRIEDWAISFAADASDQAIRNAHVLPQLQVRLEFCPAVRALLCRIAAMRQQDMGIPQRLVDENKVALRARSTVFAALSRLLR